MNLFLSDENKINPLVGAAGVSAVPDSARVVQNEGLKARSNKSLVNACHGAKCCQCNRFGSGGRYFIKLPGIIVDFKYKNK